MSKATIIYGRKNRYLIDGKEVTRAEFDRAFPTKIQDLLDSGIVPDGHRSQCWPQASRALGVHPSQVNDQMAHAKKMGVPTSFDKTGKPIFTSRGHRAEYLKHVDQRRVDYDGGYGDTTESTAAREKW
jgi:hypothetical protein